MTDALDLAIQMLRRHEGLELKPYRCTSGKLSIGYGRNLDDKGISKTEAEILLSHDLADAEQIARNWLGELYDKLAPQRQAVALDMAHQLGPGLYKFVATKVALARRDYVEAAKRMLESKVAREQAPNRWAELADLMRGEEAV